MELSFFYWKNSETRPFFFNSKTKKNIQRDSHKYKKKNYTYESIPNSTFCIYHLRKKIIEKNLTTNLIKLKEF